MSHATVARGIVRGERSKSFCLGVPQKSRKRTSPCRAPRCCDFRFGCVRSVRLVGHSTVRLFSAFLIYSIYRAQNITFCQTNFYPQLLFFLKVKSRRQNRKSNITVSSSRPPRRARTTDESIDVLIACAPGLLRFICCALVQSLFFY